MKTITHLVQVVLDDTDFLRLKYECKRSGIPLSVFMRNLLKQYFENHSPHHGKDFKQKQLEVIP